MKIIRSELDAITPPNKGYSLHWDDKLAGYGVRITANGVLSFIVQKRINGKDKRKTIGRYGVLTPEQARKLATTFLGEVAMGIDPIAREAKEKSGKVTLQQVFDDYISARKSLKHSTVKDMQRSLNELLSDKLKKPIASITPDLVKRIHTKFGEQHSEARANLGMRYLRALFNFAIEQYIDSEGRSVITDNPVTVLSRQKAWFDVQRRRTVIKPTELKVWFSAVQALRNDIARDYYLLVILTGLRRSEALDLKWEYIDFNERTLTIPDPKNHEEHTLPLSDYLLSILTIRYKEKYGDYVFEGSRGRLSNLRNSQASVRDQSNINYKIHDLRRTFATVADSIDIPAYSVKALLNHKDKSDVTAGYIIINVERLRRPMQRITDYFLSVWGVKPSADIAKITSIINQ